MATMIERVGRAIYEGRNGAGAVPWSKLPGWHRYPYTEDAKHALAAIREPTEEMLRPGIRAMGDALSRGGGDRESRQAIGYTAMIVAALEEKL